MIPTLPTKDFRFSEFDSRGELKVILDNIAEMAELMQKIRDIVGVPILISSGWRSEHHNRAVKGDAVSRHLTGRAADGVLKGMSLFDFYYAIKDSGLDFSNLILYPFDKGHFHIELPEARARGRVTVKRAGVNRYDPITPELLAKFPGAHPIDA